MKMRLTILLASALISASAAAAETAPKGPVAGVCEREIARAAALYDVPIAILYAVGLTETGNKGALHPYTLNIEGKDYVGKNLQDALTAFRAAQARGAKLIDVGCMQMNHYYHKDEFKSLEEMFDPRRNVERAASFLKELRQQAGSWTAAVARYNAGPKNTVAGKRYSCRVMKNLVYAGVGQWTPAARAYCAAGPA